MAIKYFIAECISLKKHPVAKEMKKTISYIIPVTASTQTEAKSAVYEQLKVIDEHGNNNFFQVPKLGKPVTEEEYNAALIDFESTFNDIPTEEKEPLSFIKEEHQTDVEDFDWPKPNDNGFYPASTNGVERSSITDGDFISEILILQIQKNEWVFGYRFITDIDNTAVPISVNNGVTESRELAIMQAMTNLIRTCASAQTKYGFKNTALAFDYKSEIDKAPEPDDTCIKWVSHDGYIDCPVSSIKVGDYEFSVSIANNDNQFYCSVRFSKNALLIDTEWLGKPSNEPYSNFDDALNRASGICSDILGQRGLEKHLDTLLKPSFIDVFSSNIIDSEFRVFSLKKPIAKWERIKAILDSEFSPENNVQSLPIELISSFDKLKDYTFSQQENMAFLSERVFADYSKNNPLIDIEKTIANCLNYYFGNCAEIVRTFNNAESLLAFIDDNVEFNNTDSKLSPEMAVVISSLEFDKTQDDYTIEQKEEMADKVGLVVNEFVNDNNGSYATILQLLDGYEWDDGEVIGKTLLNIRALRATIKIILAQAEEPPLFNDWIKSNKGKTFDDYCLEFNIDPPAEKQTKEPLPEAVKVTPKVTVKKAEVKLDETPSKDDETPEAATEAVDTQEIDHKEVIIPELTPEQLTNSNLELWNKGFKTDPNYTKLDPSTKRTSITTQYRIQRATEIFGPIGIGWGYTVLREWVVQGSPIIINGNYSEYREEIHKCEIEFWYIKDGEKASFTHYGDTRKMYMTSKGYFYHDDECEKKSLSDALGKAMSMIGICADVYLGEFDNGNIQQSIEKAKVADKKVKEISHNQEATLKAFDQAKEYIDEMEAAPNLSEINILKQKALATLSALPDATDDQKRKKSKAIGSIAANFERNSLRITASKKEQMEATS